MKNKDIYQDKFNQKKAPIDKAQLWNNIKAHEEFPKKPKNNKAAFFYAIPTILLVISIGIYIVHNYLTNQALNETIENNIENIKSSNLKTEELERKLNDHIAGGQNKEKLAAEQSLGSINTVTSETKTSKTKAALQVNKKTKAKASLIDPSNAFGQSASQPNNKTPLSQAKQNITNRSTFNSTSTQNSNAQQASNPAIQKSIEPFELKNPLSKATEHIALPIISLLQGKSSTIYWNERSRDLFETPQIDLELQSRKTWLLAVQLGLGRTSHHIIDGMDSMANTRLRLANITNLESQHFNFSIGKMLRRDVKISLETEYEMIFQKFALQTERTSLSSNEDMSRGFYSYAIDRTHYELFHKYKFLNLNLMGEKLFKLNKYHLSLGAGINYNLSTNVQGRIADNEGNLFEINDDNQYSNKSNISFIGSLGLNYQLNNQISLISQLRYHTKRDISGPQSDLIHDIQNLNLRIGMAFHF